MAVGYTKLPKLLPVSGIRLGTTSAGIKKTGHRDLVVVELVEGASTASVFTRNAFCAAPVIAAKEHLTQISPRYFLINTGNANAGTGQPGLEAAQYCCRSLAELTGGNESEVLPFSTGVIGEPLPVKKIVAGLPAALSALDVNGWEQAAHGILTTDTIAKGCSRQIEIQGQTITVTGIAKGSGMIRPDMATMLAYIATDASVDSVLLQQILNQAVATSFNRITVDGDTSTNDACMLVATGASDVAVTAGSEGCEALSNVIRDVCEQLAQLMIRDGEGATKFITIDVQDGRDEGECEQVAYTIAHSPLVKTAFFASDPNWGRILAAVGRAGLDTLDLNGVTIHLGDVCIVENGGRATDYEESKGQAVMDCDEITVRVNLGRGLSAVRIWTSDLSYDYIKINAEYRT
ncbi:MAG: bifunctional glutamate N-acetyltransferase/amino-acid acetyltransferase ArgJ [Gammaproteobacteria bacterium]|nr:bifunctional glutamate N-acetyltransferase/amino-acid acetyltransferase ArgJ [Gammaproteobacteria bacterium]